MSGTRFACLKAPVTELRSARTALVVCTHGGTESRAEFRGFDAEVSARRTGFERMAVCSLYGAPSLEETVARLNKLDIVLVPYFLCEGVTLDALKGRIDRIANKVRIAVSPTIGKHAALPQRITEFARAAAKKNFWLPQETGLLLVGHGSKRSNGSKHAIDAMGEAVARASAFGEVGCAYLEEPPSTEDSLGAMQSRRVIVAGCFMESGRHAMQDVPRLLAAEARPTVYLGAIGQTAWMHRLAVQQAVGFIDPMRDLYLASST